MAIKLNDRDVTCRALDDNTAVLQIQNQTFVLDYSCLIDLLMNLAQVTGQMETEDYGALKSPCH